MTDRAVHGTENETPSGPPTPPARPVDEAGPGALGEVADRDALGDAGGGSGGDSDATEPPSSATAPWAPAWVRRLPMSPRAGWIATAIATVVGAVVRLVGLDRVDALIFDETYYVKDAYSLAHLGYEGRWTDDWDLHFARGDFSGLSRQASFIVHPPTGKWLIAAGEALFGWSNPVGWRISAAVAGIIGVFLVCRLAWNLFRSPTVTLVAGLFLALDGMHLVMSRTGLLDIFVSTFVLGAFLAVVKDQQQAHPTLVRRLAAWREQERAGSGDVAAGSGDVAAGVTGGITAGIDEDDAPGDAATGAPGDAARTGPAERRGPTGRGPNSGPRWWLLVAGVLLGLACSVKWSGIYAVVVLGLFVAAREWTTRRRHGHPHAFRGAMARDVPVAFLAMVPTTIVVYVASWWGWMIHPAAWGHGRTAAAGGPASGPVAVLSDLWKYHREMWAFHTGLTTPHNYQSKPWEWLVQARPTSFYYDKVQTGCSVASGQSGDGSGVATECIRNVVALGNPLLWWLAVPALVLAVVVVVRWRDWRVGLVLCGYIAMYLPWFAYARRTIFDFYTVAFSPYVALVLAWAVGLALDQVKVGTDPDRGYSAADFGPEDHWWIGRREPLRIGLAVSGVAVVVAVVAAGVYFYPVLTGMAIPYQEWYDHMWIPRWI